jgi:hypothetical protein
MTTGFIVRSSLLVAAATAVVAAPTETWHFGGSRRPQSATAASAELWVDPGDVGRLDAFHGPGGREGAPPADGVFEVKETDTTGYSGGYTVVDGQGRTWDIKIGAEAQPEVVASRVLWLIGYHQPATYFVPNWRRKGQEARPQPSARFRLQSDHESIGEWSWTDNPFLGTRELKGLVSVNLLLNNWDFKTSNNRIYTVGQPSRGPSRWFVVQDVGASLGGSAWPTGTRNDIDAFEAQRFVSTANGELEFDYRGRHREVLDDLTAEDVAWACRLLDRISDRQWIDIFRATAYPEAVSARYRAHLEAKIAEGLALDRTARVKP